LSLVIFNGIAGMARIRQLPSNVVTKIAAGEVIERPASVVKELLENSVDAGSSRIEIDIEQGGSELIRLVDNGCGIHPDDMQLAFSSHATSKLRDADDLFRITTLGFRGEALASIGGVAQVTLQSRPPGMAQGAEIQCNGGTLSPIKPWNGSGGTRIEVRHLFYNVPVRKKFLKSISTEVGHVCESFTRLALSHPHLHLVLRHNGKLVYECPGGSPAQAIDRLKERVGLFFGADVRQQLYDVEATQGPLHLHGFIADPACERGSARQQYLFLNGRWIRDRTLGHAIQEAYRGLLMTGRYAVAFLFVEMPPELVDVNVHPTKSEVRFQNSQVMYHLVHATTRDRLGKENLTARLQPTASTLGAPQVPQPALPFVQSRPADMPPLPPRFPEPPPPVYTHSPTTPAVDYTPVAPPPTPDPPPTPAWPSVREVVAQFEPAQIIQLYDSYLVMETPEGMLVIDQHALHERILFEQFKKRVRNAPLETQRLLIPEPIELTPEQSARLLEHQAPLVELGLEVSDFGAGTVLLSSYPAILGRRNPETVLRAVVDHLTAQDRLPSREVLLNDLLSLMACHAAVRAGDRLTPQEMATLVEHRQLADDTHHCPHGRPTALLFSKQDLDKQFRRI